MEQVEQVVLVVQVEEEALLLRVQRALPVHPVHQAVLGLLEVQDQQC